MTKPIQNHRLSNLVFNYSIHSTKMPSSVRNTSRYCKIGMYLGKPGSCTMLSSGSRDIAMLMWVEDRVHVGDQRGYGRDLVDSTKEEVTRLNTLLEAFKTRPRLKFKRGNQKGFLYANLVPQVRLATITPRLKGKRTVYEARFLKQTIGQYDRQKDARSAIETAFEFFIGTDENGGDQ